MTRLRRLLLYVVLLGAVLALWLFGGRRQVRAPYGIYIAEIGGVRAQFPAPRVREALLAGETLEVVLPGNQVLWQGPAAEFMEMVVDSLAYERQGER